MNADELRQRAALVSLRTPSGSIDMQRRAELEQRIIDTFADVLTEPMDVDGGMSVMGKITEYGRANWFAAMHHYGKDDEAFKGWDKECLQNYADIRAAIAGLVAGERAEVARLRALTVAQADRIAAQSEIMGRRAEIVTQTKYEG